MIDIVEGNSISLQTGTIEKAHTLLEKYSHQAAEKRIKDVDGDSFLKVDGWIYTQGPNIQKEIPKNNDPSVFEERLHQVGTYDVNGNIIAFVGKDGCLQIGYATDANIEKLKKAGFQREFLHVPFSNAESIVGEEEYHQFEQLVHRGIEEREKEMGEGQQPTPENSNIPSLEYIPPKAQEIIRRGVVKATQELETMKNLTQQVGEWVTSFDILNQQKRLEIESVLHQPTDAGQVDQICSAFYKEVTQLKKAYKKIIKGGDSTDYLFSECFFGTLDTHGLSDEELEYFQMTLKPKVGRSANLQHRLQQLFREFHPLTRRTYLSDKDQFKDMQLSILRARFSLILKSGFIDPRNNPYKNAPLLNESQSIQAQQLLQRAPEELPNFAERSVVPAYDSISQSIKSELIQKTVIGTIAPHLKKDKKFQEIITQLHDSNIEFALEAVQSPQGHYQEWENLRVRMLSRVEEVIKEGTVKNCVELFRKKAENFRTNFFYPDGDRILTDYFSPAWYTEEVIKLCEEVTKEIERFINVLPDEISGQESGGKPLSARQPLTSLIGPLKYHQTRANKLQQEENIACQSNSFLSHATPFDIGLSILKNDVLASREYQIEHFGESFFQTGAKGDKIRVSRDYVISSSGEKTPVSAYWTNKNPLQERHQIAFAQNILADGYGDIAFVFDRRYLMRRYQFADAGDSYHLFSSHYDSDKKDTEGFYLELTQNPLLIVVKGNYREQFMQFVKEKLFQNPRWKELIGDPDKWINDHVIFSSPHSFKGVQKTQVEEKLKNLTSTEPQATQAKKVFIVPSGNFGDAPSNKNMCLYQYAQAA